MNSDQKFDQIWEFRRRDDDIDSSDDSKSNSNVGPSHKKHKLVPSLVLPDTDDISENEDQQHVQHEKKGKRVRNGPKKEKKREVKIKTKKVASPSSIKKGEGNSTRKKKSKLLSQMTVSDDFRIFTESILDDLRVARENMFAKMRQEMDALISSRPSPSSRSTTRKKGSTRAKNPNQKRASRKTNQIQPKQGTELAASKAQNGNRDCPDEQKVDKNEKENETQELVRSAAKNPVFIDCSAKKAVFTTPPVQVVSSAAASSYLTLPSVLPNSKVTDTSLNVERASLMNQNHFSGFQGEELFRSFGHISSESSSMGNGYPVALNHHQRLDMSSGYGIPSQIVQESPRDANVLGLRMHGGSIRYPMGLGSHTLPNHFAPNTFRTLYPN